MKNVFSTLSLLAGALAVFALAGCEPQKDTARNGSATGEGLNSESATGAVVAETSPTNTTESDEAISSPPAMDCGYKPPMTTGKPCGDVSDEKVPGGCDPVAQTGCGNEQHCRFAIQVDDVGQPSSFVRVCSELTCGSRTRLPGDTCEPNQCMPGSLCVSGVCKRYCQRSDGLGCGPDEFCVSAALNPEFGYCESTCDE